MVYKQFVSALAKHGVEPFDATGEEFDPERHEAIQQMIDSGQVRPDLVTRTWDATISARTRDSHLALNGMSVPWGQPFVSPVTGAMSKT